MWRPLIFIHLLFRKYFSIYQTNFASGGLPNTFATLNNKNMKWTWLIRGKLTMRYSGNSWLKK